MLLFAACAWMSAEDLAELRDSDADGSPVWEDCDDEVDTIGAPSARYEDRDGDGIGNAEAFGCTGVALGGDCDDADSAIGAPTTGYLDADGDEIVGTDAALACAGLSATPGDDCDDADPEVGSPTPQYTDADGDNFGTGEPAALCSDEGAADPGDCDDENAEVYPGASPDLCGNTDANCDGSPDNEASYREVGIAGPDHDGSAADTPPDGLGAALAFGALEGAGETVAAGSPTETLFFSLDRVRDVDYAYTRQDRFASIAGPGDSIAIGSMFVDTDDIGDVAIGDASWADGAGAVAIFDVPSGGGDYTFEDSSAIWEGAPGDRAGAALAFVEGVPGVTASLLFVGGPGADDGRGSAWILSLGGSGDPGEHALADVYYSVTAHEGDTDLALGSVVGTWFDATGAAYLTSAAPGWDATARVDAGAVFVAGFTASDVISGAVPTWVGTRAGAGAASALASEDLDDDGVRELIVGVSGVEWNGLDGAGAVYVISGADVLDGGELADAQLILGGDIGGRGVGRSLTVYSPEGGQPTLLAGAHHDLGCGDFGAIYRWQPNADGGAGSFTYSDANFRLMGELGSEFGAAIVQGGAFDLEGLQIDLLWIGSPGEARVTAHTFTATE